MTLRIGNPARVAQALTHGPDAVAYEGWFKEQVQASIDDPRPSLSDEEARRQFAAKRDALRKRVS